MRYRILGPVRVWRGDAELPLGPPKQRALLALLLARAGELLTPQEVIDALWEEPPGSAVNVVHRHVGSLRRLLEPELPSRAAASRLLRGAGGYRLRVEPDELDLLRFRSLREEARRAAAYGDRAKGVALLVDALGMWGGPAGTGLAPTVAAHPLFTALNHEYLASVKEAADAASATAQEHDRATAHAPAAQHAHGERVLTLLEQAAHHHPFDEALHARLITALAALGRQAEALAVHDSVRSRLAGELGVDPGPELRTAHERVLRQAVPVVVRAPDPRGDAAEPETRPPAPSLLPAQLPSDIATFAGRRTELALSRELLEGPDGVAGPPAAAGAAVIAAISGMAGVGKTTLAVHWAHRVAHRTGGGAGGNVARGAISVLRSSVPYIARVENREAARGGVDGETVDNAKVRAPHVLRIRDRAVTAQDYEFIACEAAPSVRRVRCLPAVAGEGGAVRVLVVPDAVADEGDDRLRFEQLIPSEQVLSAITARLDERRLVGTRLVVEPPAYQGITVVARLIADPQDVDRVREDALAALFRHLNPLHGGADGRGWPFGRPVQYGEVFAVLQRAAQNALVEEVRLFPADPVTGRRGAPVERIDVARNALVFSYQHQVVVAPGDLGGVT